jgi:hypothetical protein
MIPLIGGLSREKEPPEMRLQPKLAALQDVSADGFAATGG